jgi:hypothetical protein
MNSARSIIRRILVRRSILVARSPFKKGKSVITITMGDAAENHRGNEIIGTKATEGFKPADLAAAKTEFEAKGATCVLHDFGHTAQVLVIKGGVNVVMGKRDRVWEELIIRPWDKKALMYGQVRNKNARWNLCFGTDEEAHEACYEEGKGTVVALSSMPNLKGLVDGLPALCGPKAEGLKAEGNLYYDKEKCYIGWHGDTERRKVVAARFGATWPIHFRWFQEGETISDVFTIELEDGDMYIMSEKATGFDWKLRKIRTMRHAAGPLTTLKKVSK